MNKMIYRGMICLGSLSFVMFPTGCLTLTPIGPFADQLGSKPRAAQNSPGVKVGPVEEGSLSGLLQAPPPPPMPTLLVTPGEVSPANTNDTMQRLLREMEADRVAMEQMPATAEVSVLGRR